MTINKQNISTNDDDADIFVLSEPGASFINKGKLTTSGDLASPIHVTADGVVVDNQGELTTSGDGASAIIVGDPYEGRYDNVTVINHGTITTTGFTLDADAGPIFSAGIDLFGEHNLAVNYGTISNLDGDDAGMNSVGSYSTLLNYGRIDSQIIGMVIDQYTGTEANSTAINYGQIQTHWDESYGMVALIGDNVLKNYGSIQVDGVFSFGMALEGGHNHGENYGTILATGDLSRGVLLGGEQPTFVNYGTIRTTGEDSVGARFSGEDPSDTDGGTFTNYGTIASTAWAVRGAFADDHFVNHGKLIGDAYMGEGDDSYTAGKYGRLSGTLTLGDGNDLVTCERGCGELTIADFLAGASTDDVLDLSAFGYHSLDDVLADASQRGSDVLLKLSGHDQVVLEDVSLASLAADDFIFGVAHSPATLAVHDFASMALAHADAVAII